MKYLILGDGKLATEIHKQTNWDYISMDKNGIRFEYPGSYFDYLKSYDTIINCIGYTNTTDNTKTEHWKVNYIGVIDLVDICNKLKKKLVHISSDYIYDHSNSNASEEDIPVHSKTWYAYTKLLSDGYVQAVSQNYLLIRTSFKLRPYPWKVAWVDCNTNVDYIDTISELIIKIINLNASGVYNVGTKVKTFYDLAKETVPDCVPVVDDYAFERPHDVTMNLNKLNKLL